MKIVSVCRVYPTHRPGGMPFVAQDRARALAALGHEVIILTTGGKSSTVDEGVTVKHLSCTPEVYSSTFAESCAAECKNIKPDIIHLDSCDVNSNWWTGFKNTALTLHGFGYGAFLTKWNLFKIGLGDAPEFDPHEMLKEMRVFKSFHTVLSISKHEFNLLRDVLGVSQTKLVYNPIPKYFFRPPVAPPMIRKFLCASVSGYGTRLFNMAEEAAKEAGLDITVVSKRARTTMPDIYDKHSALIVPTAYSQGYDLTVAESLARQRPVILSDIGSYLQEGLTESGLVLTNLGDRQDLIEKMRGPLPEVSADAADRHQPMTHATNWLKAIQ